MSIAFPGGVNVDGSVSAPAVGTVLSTFAPNQRRKGFAFQNQSAVTLQVVLDDGQSGTPTIFLFGPGSGSNTQGGSWDTLPFLHLGRIRICGTAASQFAAAELV